MDRTDEAVNRRGLLESDSFSFYDELRDTLADPGASPLQSSILYTDTPRLDSSIIKVHYDDGEETKAIRLMNIACAFGLTRTGTVLYGVMASAKAALLAQYHFNNRIETIVPNLKELLTDDVGEHCNMKMTLEYYDTARSAKEGARVTSQHIHKRKFPYRTTAVMGAARSAVSAPLAILNSVQQIPQISYASTSSYLDKSEIYTLFGRTVPSSDGDAAAAMTWFKNLGVERVGILYVRDDYGNAYRNSLEKAAGNLDIITASAAISVIQEDDDSLRSAIRESLQLLQSSQYRYFVGVIFNIHLEILIEEASDMGIIGPGYFWMFGDGIGTSTLTSVRAPANSKKAAAMQGLGIVATGRATAEGQYFRYLDEYKKFDEDAEFGEYFASRSPLFTDAVTFEANRTFSSSYNSQFPPLAYDAIMALGIAACKSENDFFTGEQLFQEFLMSDFEGASGNVRIDNTTGSRVFSSITYFMINAVLTEPDEDGLVSLSAYPAAEYARRKQENGEFLVSWGNVDGVQYNFSDMTFIPPASLPALDESLNPIGTPYTAMGVVVASTIMISSVFFALWTWYNRDGRIVRASQPEFLIAICMGVFLMAAAILPLGWHNPPHSDELADVSCMLQYWLFFIGFALAFSALFAKTWRINKVRNRDTIALLLREANSSLQLLASRNKFRHVVVSPRDVALPGTCLILGNLIILSLWQAISPERFYRDKIDSVDEFGRNNESVGSCRTAENAAPSEYFLTAIAAINAAVVVAANIQAFRGRYIATEFSESRYIGIAMAATMQTLLITAVPIAFAVDSRSEYLGRAGSMLTVAAAILYIIFIPKLLYWRQHRAVLHGQTRKEEREKVSPLFNANAAIPEAASVEERSSAPQLESSLQMLEESMNSLEGSRHDPMHVARIRSFRSLAGQMSGPASFSLEDDEDSEAGLRVVDVLEESDFDRSMRDLDDLTLGSKIRHIRSERPALNSEANQTGSNRSLESARKNRSRQSAPRVRHGAVGKPLDDLAEGAEESLDFVPMPKSIQRAATG